MDTRYGLALMAAIAPDLGVARLHEFVRFDEGAVTRRVSMRIELPVSAEGVFASESSERYAVDLSPQAALPEDDQMHELPFTIMRPRKTEPVAFERLTFDGRPTMRMDHAAHRDFERTLLRLVFEAETRLADRDAATQALLLRVRDAAEQIPDLSAARAANILKRIMRGSSVLYGGASAEACLAIAVVQSARVFARLAEMLTERYLVVAILPCRAGEGGIVEYEIRSHRREIEQSINGFWSAVRWIRRGFRANPYLYTLRVPLVFATQTYELMIEGPPGTYLQNELLWLIRRSGPRSKRAELTPATFSAEPDHPSYSYFRRGFGVDNKAHLVLSGYAGPVPNYPQYHSVFATARFAEVPPGSLGIAFLTLMLLGTVQVVLLWFLRDILTTRSSFTDLAALMLAIAGVTSAWHLPLRNAKATPATARLAFTFGLVLAIATALTLVLSQMHIGAESARQLDEIDATRRYVASATLLPDPDVSTIEQMEAKLSKLLQSQVETLNSTADRSEDILGVQLSATGILLLVCGIALFKNVGRYRSVNRPSVVQI